MNTFASFTHKLQILSNYLNDYHFIFSSNSINTKELILLKNLTCSIQTDNASLILSAYEQGFERDDLYFPVQNKTLEEICLVYGKCRFILGTLEELHLINELAKNRNASGFLESIALSISLGNNLDSSNAFCESNLSILSKTLRSMDAIAVRGVFFLTETTSYSQSASAMKEAYEKVKFLTSLLPCRITYFNLGNYIDLLSTASSDPSSEALSCMERANLVSFLNSTSLYSRLLIS
ncbi:MAG: hypothetical protein ACERKN_00280 [Velocimicrobium sp.]